MATAWAPKTNHGSSRSSSTAAMTARVSPSADMVGPGEEGTHAEVRLEVRPPGIIVGPAGSGIPGAFVERYGKLDLPSNGLPGPLPPRQLLWRGPVTPGVLAKLRGVEA
jgi:hypothetical protein